MHNFIFCGNATYATSAASPDKVTPGQIAIFQNKDGITAVTADGTNVTEECNIVLGRSAADGGPVIIPFYPNHFSYTITESSAGKAFTGSVHVPTEIVPGNYTLLIVEKGKGFNERATYTVDVYVNSVTTTPAQVAEKLSKAVNDKVSVIGLKSTYTKDATNFGISAEILDGRDFELILADNLSEGSVNIAQHGEKAIGDYNYIVDLANRAAADAGFNYTYSDKDVMYPTYPFGTVSADGYKGTTFKIFNLRFAEPRKVRTVDTLIHQVVQICVISSTSAGAANTLKTIFDNIAAGISSADAASISTMDLFDNSPVNVEDMDDTNTDPTTNIEDSVVTEETKVNLEDVVE